MTSPLPPLDPELATVLAGFPAGVDPGEHLQDMNVIRMMRSTLDLLAVMGTVLPTDERVTVEDRSIPGVEPGTEIPVRVYDPAGWTGSGPRVLPRGRLRPRGPVHRGAPLPPLRGRSGLRRRVGGLPPRP